MYPVEHPNSRGNRLLLPHSLKNIGAPWLVTVDLPVTRQFSSFRIYHPWLLTNSVALVRERTIPTEQPPLVGEVSVNFCGKRGVAWSVRRLPYGRNLGSLDRTSLEHSHKVLQ
jgi:hypothetical protein